MRTDLFQHEVTETSKLFGRNTDVQVVFRGDRAMTNEKLIVLPALPLGQEIEDELAMVVRGYADHEAGHQAESDMPYIMRRYEENTAAGKVAVNRLHNGIEDPLMEDKVFRKYPGSRRYISATVEHVNGLTLERLRGGCEETLKRVKTPHVIASVAMTWAGRLHYGLPSNAELLDWLDPEFRERIMAWAEEAKGCESQADKFDLAERIWEEIKPEEEEGEDKGEGEGKEGKEDKGEGEKKEGKEDKGEGKEEDMIDPGEEWRKAVEVVFEKSFDYSGAYVPYRPELNQVYDKTSQADGEERWRYMAKASLGDELRAGSVNRYEAIRIGLAGPANRIRMRLERALMAKQESRWRGGHRMGRLDSRRLASVPTGSKDVFKMKHLGERLDTAVTVLVDHSGSMGGPKMAAAAECCIAMVEALARVDVALEVLGFATNYGDFEFSQEAAEARLPNGDEYSRHEPVRTIVYKAFDEGLLSAKPTLSVMNALAGDQNVDGESLMYAYHRLKQRDESRKVMFVLSDGQPVAQGNVARMATHLRDTTDYLGAHGVELLGIGIMSDAVKLFYPNWVKVNSAEDLAMKGIGVLEDVLMGRGHLVDRSSLAKVSGGVV